MWLASTVMGEVRAHSRGRAPGHEAMTMVRKKYCIDQPISARKTNYVMVMIIIHIAYITCLVSNDAWHAYDVNGVYTKHQRLVGSHISRNSQYCFWLLRSWARWWSVELTLLSLASTVMGEVEAHDRGEGHALWLGGKDHSSEKTLY